MYFPKYCEHELAPVHFRTRCCSGKFVNDPLLQTCCAGHIVSKNMVPFFCHPLDGCGKFRFDLNSQKCCYGKSTSTCKNVDPTCGLARYNPSTQRCCDGRHTYYIIDQMCCTAALFQNLGLVYLSLDVSRSPKGLLNKNDVVVLVAHSGV